MDIYGIIGYPIKHSLSPAMHNAAFKYLDIKAEYRKFDIRPDELENFLLNRKDVIGFNITIPHKVRAKEILDKSGRLDHYQPEGWYYTDLCGAINTVKRINDKLIYENTDVLGFLISLKEDLRFQHMDKNILLLGCGGAGRAVIAGLGYGDVASRKIYVYDSNKKAIESSMQYFLNLPPPLKPFDYLIDRLTFVYEKKQMAEIIGGCHLLVNATPIGMKEGDSCPVDKYLLHKDLFVYDLVYNRETELVKAAKGPAACGRGMLLYQGIYALEFWLDLNLTNPLRKDIVETMREALNKACRK